MTTITTRAGKGTPLSWNEVDANFTNLNNDKAETTAVALKAPIDSPTFTGTPAAPTAAVGTNTTQVATTAFVNSEISNDALLKSGGTATGQIKGITPVAAEDLTRKDYVDTMLPKAGGTMTGRLYAQQGFDTKVGITSPVAGDGNVYSGTYTPTITQGTNCTGNGGTTNGVAWRYTRVGGVITVWGGCYVPVSATGTYTTFSISLPTTTAGDANTLVGSGATNTNSGVDAVSVIGAGSSPTLSGFVRFISYASGVNNFVVLSFSYTPA